MKKSVQVLAAIFIVALVINFFTGIFSRAAIITNIRLTSSNFSITGFEQQNINPFYTKDFLAYKQDRGLGIDKIPCTTNDQEAISILNTYYKDTLSTKQYEEHIQNTDEYEVAYGNKSIVIKHPNPEDSEQFPITLHIFNCNYFHPEFNQITPTNILGTYNGPSNTDSFNELVWFLYERGVVWVVGPPNQQTKLYSSDITETENKIVRKDQGIYGVFNDSIPFNTTMYKITYEFVFDKNTKQISFTYDKKKM